MNISNKKANNLADGPYGHYCSGFVYFDSRCLAWDLATYFTYTKSLISSFLQLTRIKFVSQFGLRLSTVWLIMYSTCGLGGLGM